MINTLKRYAKNAAEKKRKPGHNSEQHFCPSWASQNNTDFSKKAKIGNNTSNAAFTQQ